MTAPSVSSQDRHRPRPASRGRALPHDSPRSRRVRLKVRFEHLARKLATGFLFATFGSGAVILAGLILPILSRLPGKGEDRELMAQRLIHRSFRFFVRLGTLLRVFDLSESGTQRLREGPTLVVANHPTLLDIVLLVSRMPQADCVVKREAWRNPFLRGIVAAAGYIPNDGGEALIAECVERLRAGRSLILFPEGSRSPERGLRRFKRGAAHVALRSGCPVTPVIVSCTPPALKRGEPWYRIPDTKMEFSLAVGEPFHAKDLVRDDVAPVIAARRFTDAMRAYFDAEVLHGEA